MILRGNQPKKKKNKKDGRPKFILAIIFLFAGCVMAKLYFLQVVDYPLYAAMASDQHDVFSKLEPARGKIFIDDQKDAKDAGEKLFPIATNKDFALIYAVPKEIANPTETALKLYEILDKARLQKSITLRIDDEFAKARNIAASTSMARLLAENDSSLSDEYKKIKIDAEIEVTKAKIISEYILKLSKKDDPYEPIKYKVDDSELAQIMGLNSKGLDYSMEKDRFYPSPELGGQLIGFVGYQGDIKVGQYGLEGFFDEELSGQTGSIKAERSANGELIILNDREYKAAENGSDLILTIDRSIQFTICQKLRDAVIAHGADGGSVIVMQPKTGAILAMCSYPDYNPNDYSDVGNTHIYNNPAVFGQFEPGSIFKLVTMAAGIDQGKVTPESTYLDKGSVMIDGWPKPIKNSDFETKGGHGVVDMITVLELSLNTGAIHVMQKIGPEMFANYLEKFGFGEKTGIELETESSGDIRSLQGKKVKPIDAATATFGQGITVTPLQMVNAYAAIANGGILMKPYIVKEIIKANGEKIVTQPREIRRVVSEKTASLMGGMLVKVVENGHGTKAKVDGYYIGGKTGTAQVPKKGGGYEETAHIGSFAGFGPVDDPVFTMLVKIDNPRDVLWAESSAAPLFGDIAKFILDYYQVAKER